MSELRADFERASHEGSFLGQASAMLDLAWPDAAARPPIVRAYAACYLGLRAKYARAWPDQLKFMNLAIQAFEGVVESAPADLEVRFLRYSFFIEIPLLAGKRPMAKADLQVLVGMLLAGDYGTVGRETQRGMILHILKGGELGRKDEEALRKLLQ